MQALRPQPQPEGRCCPTRILIVACDQTEPEVARPDLRPVTTRGRVIATQRQSQATSVPLTATL